MGKRVAILVGNQAFADGSGLDDLNTPLNNVRDLGQILKDPNFGRFDNVVIFEDKGLLELQDRISEIFAESGREDVLFFFYSGHGITDDRNRFYLACKDTVNQERKIRYTGLEGEFIKEIIEDCNSSQIIVVLDCCHSATFFDLSIGDIPENAVAGNNKGVVVLTSTSLNFAWENSQKDIPVYHSIFTHFFIQGLKEGIADDDQDGKIYISDLALFIRQRFKENFPKQEPQFRNIKGGKDILLAYNPIVKQLDSETLKFLKSPNYHIRLAGLGMIREKIDQGDLLPELRSVIEMHLEELKKDNHRSVSEESERVLNKLYPERLIFPQQEILRYDEIANPDSLRLLIWQLGSQEDEISVFKVINNLNQINELDQNEPFLETIIWDGVNHQLRPFNTNRVDHDKIPPSPVDFDIAIFLLNWDIGPMVTGNLATEFTSWLEWAVFEILDTPKTDIIPETIFLRNEGMILDPTKIGHQELEQYIESRKLFRRLWYKIERGILRRGIWKLKYKDPSLLQTAMLLQLPSIIENRGKAQVQPETIEPPLAEFKLSKHEIERISMAYLDWTYRTNSHIELRGIRKAQAPSVPLDKVYVALRGDINSSYEGFKEKELHRVELLERLYKEDQLGSFAELEDQLFEFEQDLLVTNPVMMSILERDRPGGYIPQHEEPEIVNLGEAFYKERYLVILGDPGSGKTTLVRWLAMNLARAAYLGEQRLKVEKIKVNPEELPDSSKTEKGEQKLVDLGPVRIPILVRISEYADQWERQDGKPMSLVKYLGYHSWQGEYPTLDGERIAPEKLNYVLKYHLRQGNAVVFLDGMDEITKFDDRDDIVKRIELFMGDWIESKPKGDFKKEVHLSKIDFLDNPSAYTNLPGEEGGNQIIVTSRIAGYQSSPIKRQMKHVTIEPMSRTAVEFFCYSWTRAVQSILNPKESDEALEGVVTTLSEKLIQNIFDPKKRRVRELASNPLLVTILAIVHYNQGDLPGHRSELYHLAMEILIEDWRETGLSTSEIIYVLSPLAAFIHQNIPTGLIKESDLKEIISHNLASLRGENREELSFKRTVNEFLRVVREDVGLLAARGHSLYGFLHLTFQEYLAALYLLRDQTIAAESIMEHLEDPRWREPILLAFGYTSIEWGQEAREGFFSELLRLEDPLKDLIPRIPFLIVSALREDVAISNDIIEKVVVRLIHIYQRTLSTDFLIKLEDQIEEALTFLWINNYENLIENIFIKFFSENEHDHVIMSSLAKLIGKKNWYTQRIVETMLLALKNDSLEYDFPIHRSLQGLMWLDHKNDIEEPKAPNVPSPEEWKNLKETDYDEYIRLKRNLVIEESGYQRKLEDYQSHQKIEGIELPVTKLPLKLIFQTFPEAKSRLRKDYGFFQMILAIYGGGESPRLLETKKEYHELSRFLQKEEKTRLKEIDFSPDYYISRWGAGDTIYNVAVYLDTFAGNRLKEIPSPPKFEIESIFCDSNLTPLIKKMLIERRSEGWFEEKLLNLLAGLGTKDPMLKGTYLLALLCIQKNISGFLGNSGSFLGDLEEKASFLYQCRLSLLLSRGVLFKAFHNFPLWRLLEKLKNGENPELLAIFFRSFVKLYVFFVQAPLKISNEVKTGNWPYPLNTYIDAEYYINSFQVGPDDDEIYKWALAMDLLEKEHWKDIKNIFSVIGHAGNRNYDNYLVKWELPSVGLNYRNIDEDIPFGIVDIIENASTEGIRGNLRNALVSTVLKTFRPFLESNPELLPEFLLVDFFNSSNFDETAYKGAWVQILSGNIPPLKRLLELTSQLKSPYFGTRAFNRFARYIPWLWKDSDSLIDELCSSISDPLARFQMRLERVYQRDLLGEGEGELDLLLADIEQISDPDNKARALLQTWGRFPGEIPEELFWKQLLKHTAEVKNHLDKAELLRLIRKVYPEESEKIKVMVALSSKDDPPEFVHYAQGYDGCVVQSVLEKYQDLLTSEEKELLPYLLLGVKLYDLLNGFSKLNDEDHLWLKMLSNPDDQILDEIYSKGTTAGIVLNRVKALAIDHLIKSGKSQWAKRLIPLLNHTKTDAIPFVKGWEQHADPEISDIATLILAEKSGIITIENIGTIINLLTNKEDYSRLRACLFLHGPLLGARTLEERSLKTSSINPDLMYLIARYALISLSTHPLVSDRLSNVFYILICDNTSLLAQLCDEIESSRDRIAEAKWILSRFQMIDQESLDYLVERFKSTTSLDLQLAIFKCFICISSDYLRKNNPLISVEGWEALDDLSNNLLNYGSDRFLDQMVLTESVRYILAVITDSTSGESVVHSYQELTQIAINEFGKYALSIRDYCKTSDPEKNLLQAVSAVYYINASYIEDYSLVGQMVSKKPELLGTMVQILEMYQANDKIDDILCPVRSYILYCISVAAQYCPSEITILLERDQFMALIQKAIKSQRFLNRSAAITLLSFTRIVTPNIIYHLINCLKDDQEVKEAALRALDRFRNFEEGTLEVLLEKMGTESPYIAFGISHVLVSLYRSGKMNAIQRKLIREKLSQIVTNPDYNRGIFEFFGTGWKANNEQLQIRYTGRLNQKVYQQLIQMSEINT